MRMYNKAIKCLDTEIWELKLLKYFMQQTIRQLKKVGYARLATPNSYVKMRWCNKCDKHYARCKCQEPEWTIK